MPSDNFEKLLREKIEEAQSSPQVNSDWDKDAAWLRIQEINEVDSPSAFKKKRPVWIMYAAAVMTLIILAGWPMLKLILNHNTSTKVVITKSPANSYPTNKMAFVKKNNREELIKVLPNETRDNHQAKVNPTNHRLRTKLALSTSKKNKPQLEEAAPLIIAKESVTPDSTRVPESESSVLAISSIAPPVKVKIVLGANTSSKLEFVAISENNSVNKNNKKLLSKSSKNNKKQSPKNLTAIKRDKNPLSLNPEIDL